jgi:hypothetical protein
MAEYFGRMAEFLIAVKLAFFGCMKSPELKKNSECCRILCGLRVELRCLVRAGVIATGMLSF